MSTETSLLADKLQRKSSVPYDWNAQNQPHKWDSSTLITNRPGSRYALLIRALTASARTTAICRIFRC